jgi:branched-chain amino acid transport system substrate-binding protein
MKRKVLIFLAVGIAIYFGLSLESYAQQKAIRWGVSASLQREAGIGGKNATEIAAQEINASGGILGRKVEVFYADDEANPEKSITAVKKLIFQDNADFITGGWLSGVGLAQADHIFNAKKLWFSVGPATPKLASMVKENYAKAKYFFLVGCVNSDWFAHDMALFAEEFFKNELGLTKVALLPESSVWAREMEAYLKKDLAVRGLKIVYTDVFDPKRTDFAPQFAQIRDKGAQILMMVQAAAPGVPMTKQWAATKLPVHLMGYSLASQVTDFWDKTGGACEYESTQLINGAKAPITPQTIPFYDKYVKTYGISPTYTAFGGYDALYLLKAAAEEAKSLDTEALIKTLEKIRFVGAAGVITFTPDHDLKYGKDGKKPAWAQWQKGKHEVIFPKAWATGKYIPPPWLKK